MTTTIHCQSCSRLIKEESDFGTDSDGKRSSDFCSCCYQNGVFTEPNLTRDEMVARVVGIVIENKIMAREVAQKRIPDIIKNLKRWCV